MVCCFFPCLKKKRPCEEDRYHPRPSPEIRDGPYNGTQQQHLQDNSPRPLNHGGVLQEPSSSPAVALRPPHLPEDPPERRPPSLRPPSPGGALGYSLRRFTLEELSMATDGFSAANFRGEGGFGRVHQGVLPNGRREVAVKRLKAGSAQGEREFRAEVEIISRAHHKHLVSLVGYCITTSEMMLVYDFIPNNTLEFHLYGQKTIDWPMRRRIALGSAKGLAYLHEDCDPSIIHRDIKASNILLDVNFETKVADFGLAKFLADSETHISTRVVGTHGYLDPEYFGSGKLTKKSDVYSYGVVLWELITGRKPWTLERSLLTQALKDKNFDTLVDPKLQNCYDVSEMTCMVTCAKACVNLSALERPEMSKIVRILQDAFALSSSGASNRGRAQTSDLPGPSNKGRTILDESWVGVGESGASNEGRAQASDLPDLSNKGKAIRDESWVRVRESGASSSGSSSGKGKTIRGDSPKGWVRIKKTRNRDVVEDVANLDCISELVEEESSGNGGEGFRKGL